MNQQVTVLSAANENIKGAFEKATTEIEYQRAAVAQRDQSIDELRNNLQRVESENGRLQFCRQESDNESIASLRRALISTQAIAELRDDLTLSFFSL